jgi:hypothetical protein
MFLMDDFFDIHTQMEHQCSLLLFMLTFSVDFTTDLTDHPEFLFEYLE